MPEISRFYGIVIGMFFDDHPPAHFHVRYGEHQAVIEIDSLTITKGHLPPRTFGLVVEWAAKHKAELLENWRALETDLPLSKIEPLE